jgi:hypothetical protein
VTIWLLLGRKVGKEDEKPGNRLGAAGLLFFVKTFPFSKKTHIILFS